ncbi:hypothetical protein SCALM49S_09751 [Streptomyces californicus]
MSSGIQQIHDVGAKALGWLYEHREGFRLEARPIRRWRRRWRRSGVRCCGAVCGTRTPTR